MDFASHIYVRSFYKLLETLSPREEKILSDRWGFRGGEKKTQREVGRIHGITGSRISQIERRAIRKLRHPVRVRQLILG